MKKIRKILSLCLIAGAGILLPIGVVNALTSQLTLSKTKVAPGATFSVTIIASEIPATGLGSADYVVSYNASKVEYISSSVSSGRTTADIMANNTGSAINISYLDLTPTASNGAVVVLQFKTLATALDGPAVFGLSGSSYADGNAVSVTGTTGGATLTIYQPSSACNLTSLSVNGMTLSPAFAASKSSYSLPETTAESIIINATAESGATITGIGTKTLAYGPNQFTITVTAEDGITKKTYTINVLKTDTRSKNNFLASLIFSEGTIDFKKDIYAYTVNLAETVEKVNIMATTEDVKARIKGTGIKNLVLGSNEYKVIVTAENGELKTYTVVINRGAPGTEPNLIVTNNKVLLNSLTINGIVINLITDQFVYLFGVSNDISSLTIDCLAVSPTATIEITGKEELVAGINKVLITLTDGDLKTTYTVLVNKDVEGNLANTLGDLNKETLTKPTIYKFSKTDDKTIYVSVLELIKELKTTLILNVVDEYNGLLYQVLLNSQVVATNDININFQKFDLKYLAYKTMLPEKAKVKLFLGEEYLNAKTINIYNYQAKEDTYQLVSLKAKVSNGYVDFVSNGELVYVFTPTELETNKVNKKELSNLWKYLACFVSGVGLGIGGTLGSQFGLKKFKRKKRLKVDVL